MTPSTTEEETVKCPIEGCDEEPLKRGVFMHIWQTDGKGHGPRGEVPDHITSEDLTADTAGTEEVEIDYPDDIDLDEAEYLDTYTGQVFNGKRGLMIHLGQKEGSENIPAGVTDLHRPEEFPIVETDHRGNIEELVKPAQGDVPDADPYLPWVRDSARDTEDSVPVSEIEAFIEELREGSGAATADTIEERLLGRRV